MPAALARAADPKRSAVRARSAASAALHALAVACLCDGCAPSGDNPAPSATPDPGPAATAGDAPAGADPSTEGWRTYSDSTRGIAFRYPAELGTAYIRALDWPPMVQIADGPLQCIEAGSETARAGRTERATIGGRGYCVTRESEGAAGSVYTSLAYALEQEGRVVILTFSVRAVQCGNYDDLRKRQCETERDAFDLDPLIDAIARTLELRR
jgi:hypothetical protein